MKTPIYPNDRYVLRDILTYAKPAQLFCAVRGLPCLDMATKCTNNEIIDDITNSGAGNIHNLYEALTYYLPNLTSQNLFNVIRQYNVDVRDAKNRLKVTLFELSEHNKKLRKPLDK